MTDSIGNLGYQDQKGMLKEKVDMESIARKLGKYVLYELIHWIEDRITALNNTHDGKAEERFDEEVAQISLEAVMSAAVTGTVVKESMDRIMGSSARILVYELWEIILAVQKSGSRGKTADDGTTEEESSSAGGPIGGSRFANSRTFVETEGQWT